MSIQKILKQIQKVLKQDITQLSTSNSKESPALSQDEATLKRIEEKAYELYLARGRKPGYHLEDWREAQRLVAKEKKFKK